MDPVIPADVDTEAVLGFSAALMMSVIAGIVQVFVRSGLPTKHASMLALVLGIGLSVAVSASTDGVLVVGLVRGAVVGMAAAGVWLNLTSRVSLNGHE